MTKHTSDEAHQSADAPHRDTRRGGPDRMASPAGEAGRRELIDVRTI